MISALEAGFRPGPCLSAGLDSRLFRNVAGEPWRSGAWSAGTPEGPLAVIARRIVFPLIGACVCAALNGLFLFDARCPQFADRVVQDEDVELEAVAR